MADQTINLNLIPDGVLPVVRANQCDVKRTMTFTIYEGNDLYTIPTGTTIEVQGMKGDNHVFVYGESDLLSDNTPIVAWSGNTITLNTSMQMTAAAGDAKVLFVLTNGAETLGTLMFIMRVQQNPAIDGDISDSELPAIIARATEQMQRAEAAATSAAEDASDAEAWAVGERNGTPVSSDDETYHNNSEYYSTQAGSSATTASNAKDDAVAAANRAESWSAHPPYIGANGNWYVWNIPNEQYQDSGVDASITLTIQDITMLAYNATPTVTNSGTNTDAVFHLGIPKAPVVSSVTKTGTAGLVDTYTMELQDGTTAGTFTVTNGQDGTGSVSTVNDIQPVSGNITLNLDDINDVDFSDLADGDALVYDSTTQKWVNGEGGTVQTVNNIQPVNGNVTVNLDDVADVALTTPTDGQTLVFDSANDRWVNGNSGNDIGLSIVNGMICQTYEE